jgi:RNA polymerase sigma-70 factor (ECF subfamily)
MTQPGTPGNADPARPPLAEPAARPPAAASPAPGGEHEFARFYRDYIGRLAAYLMYQGAAADLAADIAQDAMIAAYRKWAEIESPRAYTWRVAYRAFIRHVVNDPEQPVGEVPEPSPLLSRPGEAEAWLQKQHVILVLRALPPRQREVLALTIDGWTHAEIADLLGLDLAAVRSNLKKARRNADAFHHRATREEAP